MREARVCRRCVALWTLALAMAGAGVAMAQERFFVETVQVHVVNVDVFVTDRQGRPVTGLTREDFELLEDGEPVAISNFYAGSGRAVLPEEDAGAGTPALLPEEQRLHLVIVLDLAASQMFDRNTAIGHLQRFVTEALDPSARVMVLTMDRSLRVRAPMGEDREAVVAALESLRGEAGEALAAGAQRRMLLRAMENTTFAGDQDMAASRAREFYEEDARSQLLSIHGLAEQERSHALAALGTLERLVQSLAGIPGRKVLLYVGDGLSARPGEVLFQAWENRFLDLARQWSIFASMEASRYEINQPIRDLVERANTSRVMFYALEPRGGQPAAGLGAERTGGVWSPELEAMETMSRQQTLIALTSSTGGRAMISGARSVAGLETFGEELEGLYSLGFSPEPGGGDRYHTLRVKVKRDGVAIRHREGYRRRSGEAHLQDRTLAALVHGAGANPMGVALSSQRATPRPDGTFTVPLVVRVPLGNVVFLPGSVTHSGRLVLYLAVQDEQGRTTPVQRQEFPLDIPNDRILTALGQFASFTFETVMRPGPHRVAVAVQDELGGAVATATLAIPVGDGGV